MQSKRAFWLLLGGLILLLAACGGGTTDTEEPADTTTEEEAPAEEAPAEEEAAGPAVDELTIFWAQWDPADYLQEIGNMYEAETGIKVNVLQEPWGSFGDVFFAEMAAQGTSYDMVIGDSQWLGQATTQGHYLDLTEFMNSAGLTDSVTEATLTYYGEYPPGSGTYWAFPTEGDANGWAYRKDLFEDPEEMAAFEEEYGYPLAPPTTMQQLMDIAKFFTRPDEGLYGSAIYTQADYDGLTMGFQNMLFSFGGNWSDENFNPQGVINSPESVAALEFYRELYNCCQPPGMSNAFFTEVNDAFISGQAAMGMNYFAFFPALANPEVNPYAETTGYFVNPAGPSGEHFASLGGQGISIISYISPERQQAAQDFIRWFGQDEIQAAWARLGGYSANKEVLASDEFMAVAPFNAAFAETMGIVKDFYNIPVYGELLRVAQDEMGQFVVGGEGTAQEALDAVAEQHAEILKDGGFLDE
ncbi:MAG: sugar ABC transporter substrate-binding protein [Anaerolineae bacterium]|nr:sugar ABC transporter substrate-binding protein [Anaerolineae bacterium]